MVDHLTPNQSGGSPKRGFSAYASSSAGRVVVIAVAAGVLLVVAAIAAVVVMNFQTAADSTVTAGVTPGAKAAEGDGEAVEESAVPAPPVPDTTVFTFRDVFRAPLTTVETTEASSDETGTPGSSDASTTPELDPDTLYLMDVVSVDDRPNAVLAYKGKTYTLAEGKRIPETPWKVLDIRGSSVTMLYGDSPIVLSVGQGMQQK